MQKLWIQKTIVESNSAVWSLVLGLYECEISLKQIQRKPKSKISSIYLQLRSWKVNYILKSWGKVFCVCTKNSLVLDSDNFKLVFNLCMALENVGDNFSLRITILCIDIRRMHQEGPPPPPQRFLKLWPPPHSISKIPSRGGYHCSQFKRWQFGE